MKACESKIGTHECCVLTNYNFSCDKCLRKELEWLNENGVKTINSCCGHGNVDLAMIMTEGEYSNSLMKNFGYKPSRHITKEILENNKMVWIPETKFKYLKD